MEAGWFTGDLRKEAKRAGCKYILWGKVPHEVVFNLKDTGFKAFSVEVDVPEKWGYGEVGMDLGGGGLPPAGLCINFEIYVDGKLRAQSGFVSVADPRRLLVVDNLSGAGELRLVARPNKIPGKFFWGDWCDMTFYN